MNLLKNKRKLSGRALTFAMYIAIIVSMGIPGKVYAEGSVSINETTPMEYKVTQGGVTPSNGAVEWSKDSTSGVVTIKLKGNLLGMITIAEGGSYIFDANGHVIFPGVEGEGRQNNAIDGNYMLGDDIELTIRGNGTYYPGADNLIYLHSVNTKNLYIESGFFNNDDILATKIYVDKVGTDNACLFKVNSSNSIEFTEEKTEINVRNYGAFMVKQGTISEEDKAYVQHMPDPLGLRYYPNPTQSSNPGNPGQGGQNPSNPPTNPPSNPTNPGGNTTTGVSGTNYHSDETSVVIITEGEKYVKNVLAQLEKTPVNGKVIIDTKDWYCFNRTLAEKVTSMKEVDITVKYGYQGKKYEVTIPAGSDIVSLLDENGFVGFRYLDAVFGGRKITE